MNKLGRKGSTFHDTVPMLRQAGKSSAVSGESAENCVRHDLEDGEGRPSTPPHMKKYRLSTLHEPGRIVRHYGLADDPTMDGPFGRRAFAYGEDGVEDVIKTSKGEVADWKQNEGEKIYASSKREPLGRSWNPNGIQDLLGEKHQFGVKIGATEMNKNPQAKRLIYPKVSAGDSVEESEENHKQYVKTHGQYYPGEQRQRDYNWEGAGIDKDTHAFGITERHPYYDGVMKALNPLRDGEMHKDSLKIVSKRQEDFKLATAEELGKCKHQGFGDANVAEGHVYGVPSRRFEEWDVGKLIASQHAGNAMEIETADRDLGLSLRPGFRNKAPEERVFGAPTIRTDIPGRDVKSVADNNNYGNEPDAMSLVYPATAAHRGVVDRDYIKPYNSEELKSLMDKAGIHLEDGIFSKVFELGSVMDTNGNNMAKVCSVSSFKTALHQMRRAELGI